MLAVAERKIALSESMADFSAQWPENAILHRAITRGWQSVEVGPDIHWIAQACPSTKMQFCLALSRVDKDAPAILKIGE